MARSWCCGAT